MADDRPSDNTPEPKPDAKLQKADKPRKADKIAADASGESRPDTTEQDVQALRDSLTRPNAPLRPHPRPLPTKPRRVSGGVRLKRKEGEEPASVPERRLMRLIELSAGPSAIEEGAEYARLGQTRTLVVEPGLVRASVQGRRTRAYDVQLHVEAFTAEQWDTIADQLNESPHIAAEVLGGRLPQDVEEVFRPLGLSLLPASPDAIRITTTCPDTPHGMVEAGGEQAGWAKHACCVVMLLAERIAADPSVAFRLRGLPDGELAERMSHRRLLSAGGANPRPIYQPRVEGASDAALPDAEAMMERFWESPTDLDALDLAIEPPPVPTPMLRRLGPSPFEDAKFPLVGLLATCYEVARERLLKEESGEIEPGSEPEPAEEESSADEAPADEPARRPKTAEERAAAIRAKMMGKANRRK
ncbi:MAG: hypothetical protein ACIAS6_01800 [Phycisphaerales bacterium JB060]